MKYIEYKFPRGGVLRYVKNKVSHSTKFEIRFDGGTRLNTIPGLAHFCEHMLFGGTDKYNEQKITEKYYDFIGVNAQTCPRDISFTGNIITKDFPSYLDLLVEMLTKSTFPEDVVKKEAQVIKQEITESRDKNNETIFWLNNYNLMGGYFKYGNLGTVQSVNSITSEDIKNYVNKNIVAESLVVHLTSPLSYKKIKKLIAERLESKLPSNKNFKKVSLWDEKLKNGKFFKLKEQDIGKTYISINLSFDFDAFNMANKRKLGLIISMMRNTNGLYKAFRLDKRLIYGFDLYVNYLRNTCVMTFETSCDKENVNEVINTYADFIDNKLKNGFSEDALKQVKRRQLYNKAVSEPRAGGPLSRLDDLYYYNRIYDYKKLDKYVAGITLDECNEMFNDIMLNSMPSATIFGNIKKDELMTPDEFYSQFDFNNDLVKKINNQKNKVKTVKHSANKDKKSTKNK